MTDEKKKEIYDAIKISETDEQFLGAMPKGKVTCLGPADKIEEYENQSWMPILFKAGTDTYKLSLKGLIRADGLQYTSRNFRERGDLWLDGSCNGKQFDWEGKVEKKGIRKRDTAAGKAGSEYTLNVYTFKAKKVG